MDLLLTRIVDLEELEITKDAVRYIAENCGGSVRKATGILFTATRQTGEVSIEDVKEISPSVGDEFNIRLLQLAVEANETKDDSIYERNMNILDKHLDELFYDKGFSAAEVLDSIYNTVERDENMPVALKRAFYRQIAQHLYWCSVSNNPLLQLKTFFRWVVGE